MLGELGPDHGEHEDIDRDVVDRLQRLLELPAGRAVRIGEHRHHPLAVAALDLDRLLERQLLELDCVELAQALFGEIAIARCVVDLAEEDMRGVGVGVDDARAARGAEAHFVEAERPGLHALDLHAELVADDLADLRLVRGRAHGGRGEHDYR